MLLRQLSSVRLVCVICAVIVATIASPCSATAQSPNAPYDPFVDIDLEALKKKGGSPGVTPSTETVAPPQVSPPSASPTHSSALPPGTNRFDSTSVLRGDPFNGGEWSNARNGSAFAVRTLARPVCVAGLQLESAGTDIDTNGSVIKVTLMGPSGASHVVLHIEHGAINRDFSPGGRGNVVPAQSRNFPPFLTSSIEVAMSGHGWFMLRGLTFSVVECR
jgi:hypothetical protein